MTIDSLNGPGVGEAEGREFSPRRTTRGAPAFSVQGSEQSTRRSLTAEKVPAVDRQSVTAVVAAPTAVACKSDGMHVACLPALTEVVLAPKRPAHWG